MRHGSSGRKLNRTASHRKAMLRNLASSLILTERDAEFHPRITGNATGSGRWCAEELNVRRTIY